MTVTIQSLVLVIVPGYLKGLEVVGAMENGYEQEGEEVSTSLV